MLTGKPVLRDSQKQLSAARFSSVNSRYMHYFLIIQLQDPRKGPAARL